MTDNVTNQAGVSYYAQAKAYAGSCCTKKFTAFLGLEAAMALFLAGAAFAGARYGLKLDLRKSLYAAGGAAAMPVVSTVAARLFGYSLANKVAQKLTKDESVSQ